MKINIKEIEDYINNGSIYRLAKDTKLNESLLYQYRRGEKNIENMTVGTAAQIQEYLNGGNKVRKMYELIENEIEYDKKDFEYEEGMTFAYDGDSDPYVLSKFENIEDAKAELKKYNSEIRIVGSKVLVTEYYIQDGIFDEEGEFIEGSDLWDVAPLSK